VHLSMYLNSCKFNDLQPQGIESIGYFGENRLRNILFSKGLYHVNGYIKTKNDVGGQGTSERLQTREPVVT
jgi:hypothetical protein